MPKLLNDVTFYHLLARIDADLAEAVRQAKCRVCGGVLHSARYPRKPRGGPADLPSGYVENVGRRDQRSPIASQTAKAAPRRRVVAIAPVGERDEGAGIDEDRDHRRARP